MVEETLRLQETDYSEYTTVFAFLGCLFFIKPEAAIIRLNGCNHYALQRLLIHHGYLQLVEASMGPQLKTDDLTFLRLTYEVGQWT